MNRKIIVSDSVQVNHQTRHLHFTESDTSIEVERPGGDGRIDTTYLTLDGVREWIRYYQKAAELMEEGANLRGKAAKL